jgi:hypothetical protein
MPTWSSISKLTLMIAKKNQNKSFKFKMKLKLIRVVT